MKKRILGFVALGAAIMFYGKGSKWKKYSFPSTPSPFVFQVDWSGKQVMVNFKINNQVQMSRAVFNLGQRPFHHDFKTGHELSIQTIGKVVVIELIGPDSLEITHGINFVNKTVK